MTGQMHVIAQDTPVDRASILDMTPDQLKDHTKLLQERRLVAWNIYQAGVEAKKRVQEEKDKLLLDKALAKFLKLHSTIERALDKLEEAATQIQVARIVVGDL